MYVLFSQDMLWEGHTRPNRLPATPPRCLSMGTGHRHRKEKRVVTIKAIIWIPVYCRLIMNDERASINCRELAVTKKASFVSDPPVTNIDNLLSSRAEIEGVHVPLPLFHLDRTDHHTVGSDRSFGGSRCWTATRA